MAKKNSYIIIKCPECGNELQVGIASEMYTCPICNTEINILKAYAEQDDTELNDYNEGILKADMEEEQRKKRKIKRFFLCGVLPVISALALIYFAYVIFLVPYLDYKDTRKYIKEGNFELALEAIEDMSYYKGNYKDLNKQKALIYAYKSFESGDYLEGMRYVNDILGVVYVTFDADGGIVDNEEEVVKDTVIFTKPLKNGYEFNGWELVDFEVSFIKYDAHIKLKANYSIVNYRIIYDLDGGTAIGNATKYKITDKVVIRNPIKNGYEFIGWSGTGILFPIKNYEFTNKYGDIILKANWKLVTYTLELDPRGGECDIDKMELVLNQEFTLPTPVRKGYEFLGWFDGDNQYRDGVWGISGNMKLSAKWNLQEYNIKYDLDGGSYEGKTSYNCEDSNFVLGTPEKPGYTFLGWTVDVHDLPRVNYEINTQKCADIIAKANWEEQSHLIILDPNGGMVEHTTFELGYEYEYELPTPIREGYKFLGWNEEGSPEVYSSYTIRKHNDKDRTFFANWQVIKYKIEYDYAGGNQLFGIKSNYTVEEEFSLVTKMIKPGSTFLGWVGTDITTPTIEVTIPKGSTGNRKYIAVWEENYCMINLELNGGTRVDDVTDTRIKLSYTSSYNVSIAEREGFTFIGWSEVFLDTDTNFDDYPEVVNNAKKTLTLSGYDFTGVEEKTYYALFKPNVTE